MAIMTTTDHTITVTCHDCGDVDQAPAPTRSVPAQRLASLLGRGPVPQGWKRIAGRPVCPTCRVEQ